MAHLYTDVPVLARFSLVHYVASHDAMQFQNVRVSDCVCLGVLLHEAQAGEIIRNFAAGDVQGWREMTAVLRRLRDALRPAGNGDLWIGEPPTREQIEERLNGDRRACTLRL